MQARSTGGGRCNFVLELCAPLSACPAQECSAPRAVPHGLDAYWSLQEAFAKRAPRSFRGLQTHKTDGRIARVNPIARVASTKQSLAIKTRRLGPPAACFPAAVALASRLPTSPMLRCAPAGGDEDTHQQ